MAIETNKSGANKAISNSAMEKLIKKGKETGSLSYAEINDAITEDLKSPDQIEDVFTHFKELGIKLVDKEKIKKNIKKPWIKKEATLHSKK